MPTPPNAPYKVKQRIAEALEERARVGRLLVSGAKVSAAMKQQRSEQIKEARQRKLFEKPRSAA